MSTVQASSRIEFRAVLPTESPLVEWLESLRERSPAALRTFTAQHWTGLFIDGVLVSAIGYAFREDRSVFLDVLVCEPSKRGYRAAVALWALMRKCWEGRPVRFCTAVGNRHILRALAKYTAAKPTYTYWEMTA